jgi:molybdenum cofactor cytidylyltransferase
VFVTGLVLAAGGSTRLGSPKQLLPFGAGTLLDATLTMARACAFDQLIVALGGSAEDIVATVDLSGAEVVRNEEYATGCSSSIAAALPAVNRTADGIVLLLGDQPAVQPATVHSLVDAAHDAPLGVCRYRNGLGHPFWLGSETFRDLAGLHGDKAVWKLLDSGKYDTVECEVEGPIPRDVDTWDDYQSLLADGEGRE